MIRGAIAIDHQARIGLLEHGSAEHLAQPQGQWGNADIPGDVPLKRLVGQTQSCERAGNSAAGVIADEHKRRAGPLSGHDQGIGIAWQQQVIGRRCWNGR